MPQNVNLARLAAATVAALALVALGLHSSVSLAASTTLTFAPVADAGLKSSYSSSNFGTATTYKVDGSPVESFLMRFTVGGTAGQAISKATLRLYNTDASPNGGSLHRVADSTWSESAVNWTNAPAEEGAPFASLGAVSSGAWAQVDVTALVTGDGTFSLRADSSNSDGAAYSSKEAASNRPELVLTLAGLPSPSPSPSPTTSSSPTASASPTSTATPSPTAPPPAQRTASFTPVDDAVVKQSTAATNYGTATGLKADGSPIEQFLMKFTVSGTSQYAISAAKLRLYNTDPSPQGGSFHRVANNSWSQSTVTWSNAPTADTASLASLAAVSSSAWIEVDVSKLITGDGTFSLRADTTSSDGAVYNSREATSNKPQLVLTLAAPASPSTSPSASPSVSPTASPTSTPSPPSGSPSSAQPCGTAPSGPTTYDHVIWILFENKRTAMSSAPVVPHT